jgi:hypothetical protein
MTNMTPTYRVGTTEFSCYMAAVAAARAIGGEVIEIATGIARWSPPPAVDAKRQRAYRERQNAYAAQERMKREK